MIVGLGMAGIRDLLAYLRTHPLANAPAPQRNLIFGISQSGRLIQTMLLDGLHVDEDGKPAFDGAFIHVAGGGKGGFNYRFAMPTRHFSVLEDHIYPTDFFPFATAPTRDPASGVEASVLDKARALGAVPKLFYVNNSSEYWNRAASLPTTDPAGARDVAPAPQARVYLIAGAQHYAGIARTRGVFENCVNPLNHYRAMRALVLALDRWVRDGSEPPASTYPRIASGTLISVSAYKESFPHIPGVRLPEGNLRPPRLDLGPRFASARIADRVPPAAGQPFEALVPRPNADRARRRRHHAARSAGAARHPHGLQLAQRRRRLCLGDRTLGRLVHPLRAQRGGAPRRGRPAPLARSALPGPRRLRGEAARQRRRGRGARLPARGGNRRVGAPGGRFLRPHHGARSQGHELRVSLSVNPACRRASGCCTNAANDNAKGDINGRRP